MRVRWWAGWLFALGACGGEILGTGGSQLQAHDDDAGASTLDAGAGAADVTPAPAPLTTFTPHVRFVDISAGQMPGSGWYPSAQIDVARGELLVATENDAQAATPSLFRCKLDGSSCVHADLSAGRPTGCGYNPSLVLDDLDGKLIVATGPAASTATSSRLLSRTRSRRVYCAMSRSGASRATQIASAQCDAPGCVGWRWSGCRSISSA